MSRPELSEREREVLDLLARGRTNAEIGETLGITFATAKWYVSQLISKLSVASREDLAGYWRRERSLSRKGRRAARAILSIPALKLAAAGSALGAVSVSGLMVWSTLANAGGAEEPLSAAPVAAEAAATPIPTATAVPAGTVTWDEHEAAIAQTIACVEAKGVPTEIHPARGKSPTSIGFRAPSLEVGEVYRGYLEACKAQYLDDIDLRWKQQNRPTDAQAADGRAFMVACVYTELGIGKMPVDLDADQFFDLFQTLAGRGQAISEPGAYAWTMCTEQHYEEFGFWP